MNKQISGNIHEIVGFDLGHGETSLALTNPNGDAEPEKLLIHGKHSQVTAIAKDGTGKVLIGEEALDEANATELEVCFKRRPDSDAKYRQLMSVYVNSIWQHLVTTGQIGPNGSSQFFVGCPSGWSTQDMGAYERLLQESGVKNLQIVRESHAALVHAKESGILEDKEQIKGAVLVIDIGSSTTDFTFSKDRQSDSISDGYDLGGAMIDRAILQAMLAQQAQRTEVEAIFKQSTLYYHKCLIKCRKAKEEYFSNPKRFQKNSYEDSIKLQRARFEIELNAATMQKILAQPLTELQGRSWEQAFREALLKFKREKIDPQRLAKGVILTTGGASRMQFVQQACTEILPGWLYKLGSEPEHAIARGLARWGRVMVRTSDFDVDTDKLLNTQVPKIVEAYLPQLVDLLVAPLTAAILEDVVECGLIDWREGRAGTLSELEDHMESLARDWAKSTDAQRLIKRSVDAWLPLVQEAINEAGRSLCDKYQLPRSVLRITSRDYQGGSATTDISIGDPTAISDMIGNIVFWVIAAIIVVVVATPVTWIPGLIAGIVVAVVGGNVEDLLKRANLPVWMRKMVLSEAKIEQACAEQRDAMESAIREGLQSDEKLQRELPADISKALRTSLKERIDEARLLIK